jgi:hypothetical protein
METSYTERLNRNAGKSVIIDKINDISNLMHRDTLKGGANIVELNSEVFNNLGTIPTSHLTNRYKVKINDVLSNDTINVYFFGKLKGVVTLF